MILLRDEKINGAFILYRNYINKLYGLNNIHCFIQYKFTKVDHIRRLSGPNGTTNYNFFYRFNVGF